MNPDADYVKNTSMLKMSFVTEQELKELTISLRTKAQLHNSIMKNAKTVLNKRKHDCNVMKASSALLPLLKSDSQLIQSLK